MIRIAGFNGNVIKKDAAITIHTILRRPKAEPSVCAIVVSECLSSSVSSFFYGSLWPPQIVWIVIAAVFLYDISV